MQISCGSTRGIRVAAVAAWIACGALASGADALAIFDFDDFPAGGVATTDYGCNGKTFCTADDTQDARDNAIASISTRVKGVQGTFTRPPGGFADGVGILPDTGVPDDSFLNPGNIQEDGGDFNPYVGDFSRDLLFAEVTVGSGFGDVAEFGFLEIWSDPGGTGTLLGRSEEAFQNGSVRVSVHAPAETRFRSIRFGAGLTGCESGCFDESILGSQGIADDIAVQPVPEPTAALLFAAGATLTGAALRRRPARSPR